MSIKSDHWICRMAEEYQMITPFVDTSVRDRVISYGLTSYGYDIRVADEWMFFPQAMRYSLPMKGVIVDPKQNSAELFDAITASYFDIAPGTFVLARSVEHFRIPRTVSAQVIGKSTYARCGIHLLTTPLEPEWQGYITLEIANLGPLPARIYANEGIGQVQFFESDEQCEVSYADKRGKYQNQVGVVPAIIEGDCMGKDL